MRFAGRACGVRVECFVGFGALLLLTAESWAQSVAPTEPPIAQAEFPEVAPASREERESVEEAPSPVVEVPPPAYPTVESRVRSGVAPAADGLSVRAATAVAVDEDPDAIFRAFRVFVDHQRRARIGAAVAGVAAGGVTMGVGASLASNAGQDPSFWYIFGGATIGLSALSFFLPTPIERLAVHHEIDREGHSAAEARALDRAWRQVAERSARLRVINGVVVLVTGAVVTGFGFATMGGAFSFDPGFDEQLAGAILVGTGVGAVVGGVSTLLIPSPTEVAYQTYAATQPRDARLQFQLSRGPGDFGFALSRIF